MEETLFTKIIARQIPAKIAYEDERYVVIHDISPQAPVHVLVIPKLHIATVNDLEEQHSVLMGKLFMVVKRLAAQWNIVAQGYRLRVHVGRGGGQLIDHIHMHLLSGRQYRT